MDYFGSSFWARSRPKCYTMPNVRFGPECIWRSRRTLLMNLRNIVCAVDLGPQSSKILEWASQLAASFDARLTIVHATPSLVGLAWAYCVPVSSAELSRSAHEEIERLQANQERKGEVCVENGEVASVVCGAMERLRPDLLVIGRGAASKPLGRLRTHSYSIIRQAPCPVVSV